jgi:hypothetical protein
MSKYKVTTDVGRVCKTLTSIELSNLDLILLSEFLRGLTSADVERVLQESSAWLSSYQRIGAADTLIDFLMTELTDSVNTLDVKDILDEQFGEDV